MPIMDTLSGRKRQVTLLLAQGNRQKEIARTLDISVHSVKTYLQRARQQTGCDSSIELAVKCAVEISGQELSI